MRLRRKTAPKMKNRSRDPHHAPKGVADFAARRRQMILIINRRDIRVAIYSSRAAVHRRGITIPAPFRARQSCQFLETGSLHPPPAALRRFPCAPAARALQRSASPSKKEDGESRPLFVSRKPLAGRVVQKRLLPMRKNKTPSVIVEMRSGNCKLQNKGRSLKNE